jgi:hypothetical protein
VPRHKTHVEPIGLEPVGLERMAGDPMDGDPIEVEMVDVGGDGIDHAGELRSGGGRGRWLAVAAVGAAGIAVVSLAGGGGGSTTAPTLPTTTVNPTTTAPATTRDGARALPGGGAPGFRTAPLPPDALTVSALPEPTGARLLVSTTLGLYVVDVDAGAATLLSDMPGDPLDVSSTAALVRRRIGIHMVDLATGTFRSVNTPQVRALHVSSGDGRWWSTTSGLGRVDVRDDQGNNAVLALPSPTASVVDAVDGAAVVDAGGRTYLWTGPIDGAGDGAGDAPPVSDAPLALDGRVMDVADSGVALVERCDDALSCEFASVDLRTGVDVDRFPIHLADVPSSDASLPPERRFAVTPDGRWLLSCSATDQIAVEVTVDGAGSVENIPLPTSGWACDAHDGNVWIRVGTLAGAELTDLPARLDVTADSRWLFYVDVTGALRVWPVGANNTYGIDLGGQTIIAVAVIPPAPRQPLAGQPDPRP